MGFFNNTAKNIALKNGGIKTMFEQFINIFEAEGFFIQVLKSDSFMLKFESNLTTSLIGLELINESSIKIKFFMRFADGTTPEFLHFDEFYNLSQGQQNIADNLIQRIDSEISNRSRSKTFR
jgi:hypothetical protein